MFTAFRFFLCLLLAVGLQLSACAAPAPAPAAQGLIAQNDGFVIVEAGKQTSAEFKVCPVGVGSRLTTPPICVKEEHIFGKEVTTPLVTPQGALDLHFGSGVAKVVGLAPYGYAGSVVIFYRLVGR